MQLKPTVSLYLDVRKLLKNGAYMLKVRVTFNYKGKFVQKYYSTGKTLKEKQWDNIRKGKVPATLRKLNTFVLAKQAEAQDIVDTNPAISPDLFEATYLGKFTRSVDISALFVEVTDKLKAEERISTASAYSCALESLKEFRGDVPLTVIDIDFLREYEREMLKKGNKLTTIGFYLRALRAVFNTAIDRKLISADLYPFGRKGYVIPKGSNIKKALKKTEKAQLEKAKFQNDEERHAVWYWLFSYYNNGMNFTDMAYLEPANVKGDTLEYIRRKTMRTEREQKPMRVILRPESKRILAELGNHKPYCFGIITPEMTAQERYVAVQSWIKKTNRYLNQVAKRIGFQDKLNTYNARHTFATVLLKGGADIKAIQESLGHGSIATTESYLQGLDIEEAKKLSRLL
jgi:integrase/recombinase XerD